MDSTFRQSKYIIPYCVYISLKKRSNISTIYFSNSFWRSMYNVTYTLKNVNYWNILSKSYFSYTVYTHEILYLLFLYRTKMEFSFHHEHIIAMNYYLKTKQQMYGKFCSNNNLLLFLYKFFVIKTTFFHLFLFLNLY